MSVKRYQPVAQCVEPSYQAQMIVPKVMEFSEGEYVLHSDYARLKAEVERLRKAGDALYESEIGYYGEQILVDPKHHSGELCRNWIAAKEGKQP